MTPTLEHILEEVKTLSPTERHQLRDMLDREATGQQPMRARRDPTLIRELRGKYRDVLPSSEDFMRRKQVEIELEEARDRRRRGIE